MPSDIASPRTVPSDYKKRRFRFICVTAAVGQYPASEAIQLDVRLRNLNRNLAESATLGNSTSDRNRHFFYSDSTERYNDRIRSRHALW
jgi:hypothetical protein